MTTKNAGSVSTDVAREANKAMLDDAALSSITDLESAFKVMQESGMVAESFDDYGSGFSVLEDKAQLIKKAFLILEWRFADGDFGPFVSATVVTREGGKFIVNDGSTGIYKQLRGVTDTRIAKGMAQPQAGLLVERGLRVSEYDNPTGQGKSRTYYLAN